MGHQDEKRGAGVSERHVVPSCLRPEAPAPPFLVEDPIGSLLDLQRDLLAVVRRIDGVLSELTGGER